MNPIRTVNIHLKGRGYSGISSTLIRYMQVKTWKYRKKTVTVSVRDCEEISVIVYPGCAASEKLYVVGMYDPEGMVTMKRLIKPGDIFYDVGANIGSFSLLAHRYGASVFAFEGHPITANRCMANFELNGVDSGRVFAVAISDFDGCVPFSHVPGSSVNRIIEGSTSDVGGTILVPAISLDTFAAAHNHPSVVKIDTEGHELPIIKGMKSFIKTVKYLTFEANGLSSESDLLSINKILSDAGFMVGNIDWINNIFVHRNDLGARSPTGDYIAINKSFMYLFEDLGIRVVDCPG